MKTVFSPKNLLDQQLLRIVSIDKGHANILLSAGFGDMRFQIWGV